jgi:hypothetical protein
VLVVGGDEDNLGRAARADQPARHFETGEARHLDIEKDHIRLQPLDRGQRLDAVARLSNHFNTADLVEQVAHLVPRQLLVVDEDGF